jgi:hypothetical protein
LLSKDNRSAGKRYVLFIAVFRTEIVFFNFFYWCFIFYLSCCCSLVIYFLFLISFFLKLLYYFYSSNHWFNWQIKPVVHINYIYSSSQWAIMYLDKLRNTDIEYSQKLEFDHFMLFVLVVWWLWQINTSLVIIRDIYHVIVYLHKNQKLRHLEHSKTYSSRLNFMEGFGMF